MHSLPRILNLLSVLIALGLTSATYIPSPYPTATARPSPTLAPRCNDGDCSGSTATVLQASVVTSTILSITSVPCYITTFVTDHQTVTSTMYNTETVTETMTKEGKVFIVLYEPKPIVKSTVVQKVVQVTVDVVSYWVESSGVAGSSTLREEWTTMSGGGGRPDCPTCVGNGKPAQAQSQSQSQPQQGGPAWTHVGAAPTGSTLKPATGDGWAAAAGGGVAVSGQSGAGTTWGNVAVNEKWQSAASHGKVLNGILVIACLGAAVAVGTGLLL